MYELVEAAATIQLRRGERFDVSIISQLQLANGSCLDALVCNLSSRGFMINTPEYIPAHAILSVVIPGIGTCPARAIWSFCGDTGAEFLQPIDLDLYWEATQPPQETRREAPINTDHLGRWLERGAERFEVEGRVTIRTADYRTIEVEVRDISSLGLKAAVPEPLPIASFVKIDVPGIGPVEAEVKWSFSGHFGAMFATPIDLRRCDWTRNLD